MNPPVDFSRFIADHVSAIPKSGIRDFFEVVQSMTDVISLGIGEPDYVTPWRIREAAIFALVVGGVVLAAILVTLFNYMISTPLQEITSALRAMGRGIVDVPVSATSRDRKSVV